MTFRILARSNIKDSMTFLIAEPPLRRADHQRCEGGHATQTHTPDICTTSEGIKLTRVHHGFPRAGALGGGAHQGIPYSRKAERRTAVAAISMVTAGIDARSWTRSEGTTSLPRAGRWSAQTLCAQTSGLSTLTAGQRRRQLIKSAGMNKGRVDSKVMFLRPQPGSDALAGRGLRV